VSGNSNLISFLPRLRIFGALIAGTRIEFVVARPVFDEDGKFHILFESNMKSWTFDLLPEGESNVLYKRANLLLFTSIRFECVEILCEDTDVETKALISGIDFKNCNFFEIYFTN
jgi:hypothetical protein